MLRDEVHTRPGVDVVHSLGIKGSGFYIFVIERDDAGNSLLNFKQTNSTAILHVHAVLWLFYSLFCLFPHYIVNGYH